MKSEEETMMSMENVQLKTSIQLDTAQIDMSIRDNKEFGEKGKIYFKYLTDSETLSNLIDSSDSEAKDRYLAEINEGFHYIGILSEDLSKEKLGVNVYLNGDIYLGQWKNDQKNGNGYYKYAGNSQVVSDLYVGTWENGRKKGKGVYFMVSAPLSVSNLSKSNFDVAMGTFDDNNFIEGMLFQQTIDEKNEVTRQIYIGQLNQEKQKEDQNGVLIAENLIFIGEFEKDQIIQGKILNYSNEDEVKIENVYYYNTKEENFKNIKLNKSEENEYIQLKPKYNIKSIYEQIENYYFSIYDAGVKHLDYETFEKNITSVMEIINRHSTFVEDNIIKI